MAAETRPLTPRRARLRPPRLSGDVIARPRLVAQLDQLSTLALIIAPAGYGKTTLVSLWLAKRNLPHAWVSLAEEDNDPAQFLLAVVTALRAIDEGIGASLLELLNAPHEPPFGWLARQLVNELDAVSGEFALILDDYHVIEEQRIHDLIVELVTHPPRALTLVITSRHDPPIPPALRVRSGTRELRTHDLGFTPVETAAFMAKVLERPVDEQESVAIATQAEGWVASIRLMALYARNRAPGLVGTNLPGTELLHRSGRQVLDYLSTAVLDKLAAPVQDFLVRTSLLERLNRRLCDHLMGWEADGGRSGALLPQLMRDGLFLVALDAEGEWYRYHALFRQALQGMLQVRCAPEEVTQLHERAAAWYEQNDLLEEALRHVLAGGNFAGAAALVGRHRPRLLDRFQLRRLERWLALFPQAAIDKEADLLLAQVWVAAWRFDLRETSRTTDQLVQLLAGLPADMPQMAAWRGELAALQSQLSLAAGDVESAIEAGEEALDATRPEHYYPRGFALLHLVVAMQMAGRPHEATMRLEEVTQRQFGSRDWAMLAWLHPRQHLELAAGDMSGLQVHHRALLEIAGAHEMAPTIAWAHYFGGCADYLQNNLAAAAAHFRAVLDGVYFAHAGCYAHSAIGLALVLQAQGLPAAAVAVVEAARAQLAERGNTTMLQTIDAFAAELAARQGHIAAAQRWLLHEGRTALFDLLPLFYRPDLAAIRVLLATGTHAASQEAQAKATFAADLARRTHNLHVEIQAEALAAAAFEQMGERPLALARLRYALMVAEPGGIVRVFADLAEVLLPVVAELAGDAQASAFVLLVHNLLERAVAEPATVTLPGVAPVGEAPAQVFPVNGTSPDATLLDREHRLTFREVDVLHLLERRLTNKEIGRQLGISTETVKQHTVNLFRKLGVRNRRQAIVAGRVWGYLGGSQ